MTRTHFSHLASLVIPALFLSVAAAPLHAQYQGPPVTQPVPPQLTGPSVGANPPVVTAAENSPAAFPIVAYPGDSLEVSVVGVAAINAVRPQVDSDGNIGLPFIGVVHVGGLTVVEMQAAIAKKYAEGQYILNPQITVQILSSPSQVISVTGEVKGPAVVPALGPRKLLDVIAACGGFTPLASHLVTISRRSSDKTFQVLLDPNPMDSTLTNVPVYPGDTVIVPRSGQVYITGSVKLQNSYPLSSNTPLTVMQAITLAGGTNFEAALSEARIIRTQGNERTAIKLDLKRIYRGQEADPILQADDIIYVPGSVIKGAIKGGGASVLTSAILGIAYLQNK
jgi:polysaccharide export outer membrane protein